LFGAGHLELLVSLLVFAGVMGAILYPVFRQAKESAKVDRAMSNASAISRVIDLYATDYDDCLPPFKSAKTAVSYLMPYLSSQPNGDELQTFAMSNIWNDQASRFMKNVIHSQDKVWLFHTSEPIFHSSFLVGYLDGHNRLVKAALLDQVKRESWKEIVSVQE